MDVHSFCRAFQISVSCAVLVLYSFQIEDHARIHSKLEIIIANKMGELTTNQKVEKQTKLSTLKVTTYLLK